MEYILIQSRHWYHSELSVINHGTYFDAEYKQQSNKYIQYVKIYHHTICPETKIKIVTENQHASQEKSKCIGKTG